jgi:hypothetical protein
VVAPAARAVNPVRAVAIAMKAAAPAFLRPLNPS